jgi:cell fate (sporulation/competence/biofilm development) regulator YlbF (YheA/YmcA/DUF963 family)
MRQTEQNQTDSATGRAAREVALSLARKLAESKIYKEFEAASMAFRGDLMAQKLFRDYQSAQRETQRIQSWGGRNKAFEDRFQRLEKELLAHPMHRRYLASQEDLLVALKDLNDYLTDKLGFDFADLTKPAGGCC